MTDQMEKSELYLQNYLSSIFNKKTQKFKRVISSPLRYPGGKTKAIGIILDLLPKLREKKIVSPFFGGGSVELVLSQVLDIQVIGYDVFEMLTNFWTILFTQKDDFVNELRKFEINNEEFTRNRHILLYYWDQIKPDDLIYNTQKKIQLTKEEKELLNNSKLMQAVYYYYNMTLSYGPMFLGWPSSVEINKEKFDRKMKGIQERSFKNISVECLNFESSILKHNTDFLFLDPPYYLGEGSKMFKGMYPNCNFAIHHNNFNHVKLCELLKNHKGGFLLTYNNCEVVRALYKEYEQVFPEWQYSYGQGETRIGKNRKNNITEEKIDSHVKESHEIIIICPPM